MSDAPKEVTAAVVQRRLEAFALGVLDVTRALLGKPESADMSRQLRRAATGCCANYGAANVARSHADFTSKVGVALEEVDESRRWLRLLKATGLLEHAHTAGLLQEAGELRAILWATHETARKNRDYYRRQGR